MRAPSNKDALTVTVGMDIAAFDSVCREFFDRLAATPKCLAEKFVGFADLAEQLFCIREDSDTTAGASKLTVFLEPSDLFLRLLSALRTGDGDAAVTEQLLDSIRHDFSSAGSVVTTSEDRAPAESQGSVGACSQRGE